MFPKVQCIVCKLCFCCESCRLIHEKTEHNLSYDCPICRENRFLCHPHLLNKEFIRHLADNHLPLKCKNCNNIFKTMEDLINIDKCVSISELIKTPNTTQTDSEEVNNAFELVYEKSSDDSNSNESEDIKIIEVNKFNKTAVITPTIRLKEEVDSESINLQSEESLIEDAMKCLSKIVPKTPNFKKGRAPTPHAKKLLSLMRQNAIDYGNTINIEGNYSDSNVNTFKPNGNEINDDSKKDMLSTTPISQIQHLLKVAQTVTTSTPTHPSTSAWSMFPEQGTDSPLSEIGSTESPAQSIDNEAVKPEANLKIPVLKSIIVTESRFGSQNSEEGNLQESANTTDASFKRKKVKFAEDTVFEPESKIKRVFRKPRRMLTPGPQRNRFCYNPRFQALLNRFESQNRTPVACKEEINSDSTPPISDHNVQARAINFKEESPTLESDNLSKESNDLFVSCVDVPNEPTNNSVNTLTANIASTLQNCLTTVLNSNDEETEIQFKFVITKKKISVKKSINDGDCINHNSEMIKTNVQSNKETIWSSVTRVVKSVFWGDQDSSTPYRSARSNDSMASSGSKRKYEDMSDSDISPINHKRYKNVDRIRGRPPIRRNNLWGESGLGLQPTSTFAFPERTKSF